MFILEEQRYIQEDLERLEQAIADRVRDEPKHVSMRAQNPVFAFANHKYFRFAID